MRRRLYKKRIIHKKIHKKKNYIRNKIYKEGLCKERTIWEYQKVIIQGKNNIREVIIYIKELYKRELHRKKK